MSLVQLAFRQLAQSVLKGKTYADDRVLNQPLDPISEIYSPNGGNIDKCALAVYTHSSEAMPEGKATHQAQQYIEVRVYAYVPGGRITNDSGSLQASEGGAATVLNLIGRQIDGALFHRSDDVFGRLIQKLVTSVSKTKTQFVLLELEDNIRIGCLECRYEVETIYEPEYGSGLMGFWGVFDAEIRKTEPELADLIKSLIVEPEGLHPWQDFQNNQGLTDAALAATGHGPVTDDGTTPTLSDVDLVGDVTISTPDLSPAKSDI